MCVCVLTSSDSYIHIMLVVRGFKSMFIKPPAYAMIYTYVWEHVQP